LPGDHAGHLIADQFGGSRFLDNLVSQIGNTVNQSAFGKLEKTWKKALQNGESVEVKIKVNYDGNSVRPSSFDVQYKIGGADMVKHPTIFN
jgi:toxin YxiD